MAINGIDPAAKAPSRIRRNWARTTKGAVASTLVTVQPVTVDTQDRLVLNIASAGGIDTAVGALKLKLKTISALAVSSTGLSVTVDDSTIEISSNALRIKDSGVTAGKIAADAVITVKIIDSAVTGVKIADATIPGNKLIPGLTLPPFKLSEAVNQAMGTVTLAAGVAVVGNTRVTANSRVFMTSVLPGGVVGFWDTATRTAGTSFTITSSSVADTSTIAWLLVEPA